MENYKLTKKITKYSSFKSENFKIPVWTEFLGQIIKIGTGRSMIRDIESKGKLHGAIYCPESFVMMLCYCAYLKAMRYEPMY